MPDGMGFPLFFVVPGPMVTWPFLLLALRRIAAVLRRGRIRRRFGCRFPRGRTARKRRDAVPDLPHGHALYFFRGDGGVQRRQLPVGAIFAIGKPALVGFLHLLGPA